MSRVASAVVARGGSTFLLVAKYHTAVTWHCPSRPWGSAPLPRTPPCGESSRAGPRLAGRVAERPRSTSRFPDWNHWGSGTEWVPGPARMRPVRTAKLRRRRWPHADGSAVTRTRAVATARGRGARERTVRPSRPRPRPWHSVCWSRSGRRRPQRCPGRWSRAGARRARPHPVSGGPTVSESAALTLGVTYALKYAIDETRPNGDGHLFPSACVDFLRLGRSLMRKRYGWEYGLPAYAAASFVAYSRVEAGSTIHRMSSPGQLSDHQQLHLYPTIRRVVDSARRRSPVLRNQAKSHMVVEWRLADARTLRRAGNRAVTARIEKKTARAGRGHLLMVEATSRPMPTSKLASRDFGHARAREEDETWRSGRRGKRRGRART